MAIRQTPVWRIFLLALGAVAVHGYHLGVDDAEIYVPAIKQAADPSLFPFASQFFLTHAHLSLFANLVGGSGRLSFLPIDLVIFLWHIGAVFALLLACWRLGSHAFQSEEARWGGVMLVAAVLTVPVAGTALVLMDPYLTARSLSAPAILFAIVSLVSNHPWRAVCWWLVTALIHPHMAVFGAAFLVLLAGWGYVRVRQPSPAFGYGAMLPFLFALGPARGPAREALFSRTYFFVLNWAWYEWVGVVAPLALAWWLSRIATGRTNPAYRVLLRSAVVLGCGFTALALLLETSDRFENYLRWQPMRAFHIVYLILFLMLGGVLGEHVLTRKAWRWAVLFPALAGAMFLVQHQAYASSSHIEWPGGTDPNRWNAAFRWIRGNTPKDAIFSLDPDYLAAPGEDTQGFRAIAERSALADNLKDSGAVSLFPQLADEWKTEVDAQRGVDHVGCTGLAALTARYNVTWVVVRRPAGFELACPYDRAGIAVCHVPGPLSVPVGVTQVAQHVVR